MAEALVDFSEALASTVASHSQSVVRLESRRRMPASGFVWSADGLIVTAHHVVHREENITVGLPNGESTTATLVGRDPTTDIAVLKAEATGLPAPTLGAPEELQVGHLVLALGRPGRGIRASMGIASALGDNWRTPVGGTLDRYMQTDLVMYPGFSGGPLVAASGGILGLNTSGMLRGVTLTVPVSNIRRVVEAVLTHGKVRRGYLGVSAQPVRLPDAHAESIGQETGLLLVAIEDESPAGQRGLLLGDILVTLTGQPIRYLDDLLGSLTGDLIGKEVPTKIIRGGQLTDITLLVGERQ